MYVTIRLEQPEDRADIAKVHEEAFPSPGEARLVDALRISGNLSLSLVAVDELEVIGHVAISPVSLERAAGNVTGLGLGPVAVLPRRQGEGVGSALIRAALEKCRDLGARFVVVLGEPAYYQRFGFRAASSWGIANEYNADDAFMALELAAGSIPRSGTLARYAPEFSSVA